MGQTQWDQDRARIRSICAHLTRGGVFEPLAEGPGEDRAWNVGELASLIEGNLGQQIDVDSLSADQRRQWELKASWDHRPLPRPRRDFYRPHWLLDDGRIGTISIATMFMGFSLLDVSSLFVAPAFRGRGIARRALEATYRTALDAGAGGLVLSTSWTWQHSVRFYLHLGMWVRSWKRELRLTWAPDLPVYRVEIDASLARFLVTTKFGFQAWLEAEPCGDRLRWRELPAYRALSAGESRPEAWHDAAGTFALHLALAGWPLIRSDELWRKGRYSDFGPPEALAYKIEVFEAIARRDSFVVPTPRIPGIAYRDLDDID